MGRNQDGKAVFASKRGTYDRNGAGFKGDQTGSDKSVAFRLPCEASENWVCVFEAPIDLMSFCTLHRKVHSNAAALCGLPERPLDAYLKEYTIGNTVAVLSQISLDSACSFSYNQMTEPA